MYGQFENVPGLQPNNFYICSFCCVIVHNTVRVSQYLSNSNSVVFTRLGLSEVDLSCDCVLHYVCPL